MNTNGSAGHFSTAAWAVVLLLWPVAVLNYMDRMMIATMRSSIRADIIDIDNDKKFGLLMAIFMWVYAACSPLGGYLADRLSRQWTIVSSLVVWSAVTWLTGHAQSFAQMAWLRAAMGISEAFYMPAALALIASLHGPATRSTAVGLHLSGVYAGQALGGLGGWIADKGSWRDAFSMFGLIGVVYGIALFICLPRNITSTTNATTSSRGGSAPPAGTLLLGSLGFILLVIHFTLPAQAGWAVKNWLPTFLSSEYGLKQGPAGLSATGYVTLASIVGTVVGGYLADVSSRRCRRGVIYVSALGVAICIPSLLVMGSGVSLAGMIAGMLGFGLGFGIFDANNMPILSRLAPDKYRATGYGVMNLVSIGVGAGTTVALGAMRDGGVSLAWAFILSALVAAVSIAVVLCIRFPSEERSGQ